MSGEIGDCDKCGKPINDITEVGYMGPVCRERMECNPCMDFETICAKCEGSSVTDR